MKTFSGIGSAIALLIVMEATALAAAEVPAMPTLQRFNDPRPMVIAHRGCWQKTAENSLASLDSCIRQSIDAAEVDIRTTQDGALVLLHDATLERTTDLTGPLSKFTLADVLDSKLREGAGGPGSRLTNEKIPTLSQALRLAKGRMLLFLDTKCQDCEEAIKKEVEAEGAQDWVVFIGSIDNKHLHTSDWRKNQTLTWINDCRSRPYLPQMKGCFNTFGDGVRNFGVDGRFLFLAMSRETSFFTDSMNAPELRGVKAVVGAFVRRRSEMTDKELLAAEKRQWEVFLKAGPSAIIGDSPDEMLELMRAIGNR